MDEQGKKKKRADIILIGVLLALALAMFGLVRLTRQEGAMVSVYVDGEFKASYPLDVDTRVRLDHPSGSFNDLVIENGVADVVDAGCPDKICVNMRPIHYDGESIICLPNRTEIRIEGGESSGLDVG